MPRIGLIHTTKAAMREEFTRRGIPCDGDALEEYDAPETIETLERTLHELGYEVLTLAWGRDLVEAALALHDCDAILNLAEGYGGRSREAQVPSLLEMMDLGDKLIGSDALALTLSLDKGACRALVQAANVPVPKGFVVSLEGGAGSAPYGRKVHCDGFPLIVKPVREGSSRGIGRTSIVYDDEQLVNQVAHIHEVYAQPALVEQFCSGPEITVGLTGEGLTTWGVMGIVPVKSDPSWIYGLEAKRAWETEVTYELLEDGPMRNQCSLAAFHAAKALGCRDFARVDIRYAGRKPYVLDVNPLPGLNPTSSDLCILTRLKEATYPELVRSILEGPQKRGILPRNGP